MPARVPNVVAAIPPAGSVVNAEKLLQPRPVAAMAIPPSFVSMPASAAQLTDRISNSPTILEDSVNEVGKDDNAQVKIKVHKTFYFFGLGSMDEVKVHGKKRQQAFLYD